MRGSCLVGTVESDAISQSSTLRIVPEGLYRKDSLTHLDRRVYKDLSTMTHVQASHIVAESLPSHISIKVLVTPTNPTTHIRNHSSCIMPPEFDPKNITSGGWEYHSYSNKRILEALDLDYKYDHPQIYQDMCK